MSWQAGALPLTRGFAAEAEGFPVFAKGFGALLGLHHHQRHQLKRMKGNFWFMLRRDGKAAFGRRL